MYKVHLKKLDHFRSFPDCDSSAYFFFIPPLFWQFRFSWQNGGDCQLLWGVSWECGHSSYLLITFLMPLRFMVDGVLMFLQVVSAWFSQKSSLLLLCCWLLSLWPSRYFYFLDVLALVLISLYSHGDFYLILRTLHLFSHFWVGKRGIIFFHICREMAGIWHICNKCLTHTGRLTLYLAIAHSRRNLVHTSYVWGMY